MATLSKCTQPYMATRTMTLRGATQRDWRATQAVGTFNDPITAAANSSGLSGQFSYGTKFYIPELEKYFIIGDYMADASGGASHVDLWVGGDASIPASQQNAAEWALTNNYQIILNPPSNEPVNTTPLITAADNLDPSSIIIRVR